MPSATTEQPDAPTKGSRKKKVIIAVVVVLLVAGAGYWFLLKPPAAEAAPEPGEVVTMEAIQINLDNAQYLRLGLALQLTAELAHPADGSQALDAAIEVFSGQSAVDLADPEKRAALKEKLMKELEHDYHGDVMDVYFTDFVTQ